jgi:hypothetical protein
VVNERAKEILASAFATVARIEAREPYDPPPYTTRQPTRRRRTVYETNEQAEAPTTLDTATQARWDAWANEIVQAKLETFSEILGAEIGQMEKRFNEKLKVLEDKVAELSAQVEQLENLRNYNVMPLRSVANG